MGKAKSWLDVEADRVGNMGDRIFASREGDLCFYCGEALNTGRSVYWAGTSLPEFEEHERGGVLHLHAECAAELGAHLASDGFDALSGIDTGRGAWPRLLERAGHNWQKWCREAKLRQPFLGVTVDCPAEEETSSR